MTKNVLQHAYRGVVALNNYGTYLVEKKAYSQALFTFQDALQTLRMLFDAADANCTPNGDGDQDSLANSSVALTRIHNSVQKAAVRMAESTLQTQNTIPDTTGITVHVVSTSDYDKAIADVHQGSTSTIYLVRFDDVDCCSEATFNCLDDGSSATTSYLEMHAAGILLNMAVVRCCLSLTTTNELAHESSSATMNLAFMSQEILSRLSVQLSEDGFSFLQRRNLCLNYTLAQSHFVIFQTFRRHNYPTGITDETVLHELQEKIKYLKDALQDGLSPWSEAVEFVAAAAA